MPKLLIDGDVIVYRCGFAVEKTQYLVQTKAPSIGAISYDEYDNAKDAKAALGDSDRLWTRKEVEPKAHALALVNTVMQDICDRYPEFDPCVFLSGPSNFRDSIARRAKYKGNRDAQLRPAHFGAIRDHLQSKWNTSVTYGEEADDAIGIGMSASPESISVSVDKDLYQLAGRHYNWTDKQERTITVRQSNLFFYQQVLSGDATDNIPGIEGIGPVRAKRILAGCTGSRDAWKRCTDAYRAKYDDSGYEFALETARLVYIRRAPDELWQPPL